MNYIEWCLLTPAEHMDNSDLRQTYKLVENLASGKFSDEVSLLKSLVKEIVNDDSFEINGGRIWELSGEGEEYLLRFQYGNVTEIPEGYILRISEQKHLFEKISEHRTVLNREKDSFLKSKGIRIYSATAVGDLVKKGDKKYYQFIISFNAEEILQSFFETLTIISSVATVAMRNLSQQVQQDKINYDLIQASEIQRNLLPEHYREFHDYKIFGICIPDSAVGGDYFDYFAQQGDEDERLGIVISDAASKGLPAAIQALFVSGAIRMGKSFSTKISQLISRLNTLIFDTFLYERFVTLFYCELTLSSNRLVLYANAGHCEPIHYSPQKDRVKVLRSTGGLLGLLREQKFGVENTQMRPGDVLLLYTDGITESRNKDGEIFGTDRLEEMIKKHHKKTAKGIAYSLIEEVQKFTSNSPFNDDKTLVVIKRDL